MSQTIAKYAGPHRLPLAGCVGRSVECPQCKAPASVKAARHTRSAAGEVVASVFWMRVECTGHCGAILRKSNEECVVLGVAPEDVEHRTIAASVGRWCKCPRCGERSLAQFRTDLPGHADGCHAVQCPQCQVRDYDPETVVEVLTS